jgi:DNA repair exonuclease SbcCD nuclease subunit
VTGDLHLNDNPRDEDRWGLFDWILSQVDPFGLKLLIIMGDLTDAKDRHSAKLANRLARALHDLARAGVRVILLKGNHDFIDPQWPFFEWVNMIKGVDFISRPELLHLELFGSRSSEACLFLPSTKDLSDWDAIAFEDADFIFTHHTFSGCIVENGQILDGLPPSIFKKRGFTGKAYSGDIHVPQVVSKLVEYAGAPYRCHFGDSYTPRLICLDRGEAFDVHYPGRGRELLVVTEPADLHKIPEGTQVKIRVSLGRSDYDQWASKKREFLEEAQARGLEVCGIEPLVSRATTNRSADQIDEEQSFDPKELIEARGRRDRLSEAQVEIGLQIFKEIKDA